MIVYAYIAEVKGMLPQAIQNFRKSIASLRKDKSLTELITATVKDPGGGQAELQECFVELLTPHADSIIAADTPYPEAQEAVQAVPSLYIALARAAADSRRKSRLRSSATSSRSRLRSRSPTRSGYGDARSYHYLLNGGIDNLYADSEYRCPSCVSVFHKNFAPDEVFMHACRPEKRNEEWGNEYSAEEWREAFRVKR